jgi:hypothetical protein
MTFVGDSTLKKWKPKQLLREAARVYDQRAEQLGDFQQLYRELAVRWSLVTGCEITPAMTARMLLEMKLARWNSNFIEDHAVDAANYAVIAAALEGDDDGIFE